MKKLVVFTFGRMNPFTNGHYHLAQVMEKTASKFPTIYKSRIYLSHTQNSTKDPLSYNDKIKYAKDSLVYYDKIQVTKSKARTVIEVAKELESEGFTDIILVVGSDRVQEFKKLLQKYNGKDYTFNSIKVVSAGERDPDADDITGMSASKVRALAVKGDFEEFKKGIPPILPRKVKELYDKIRKAMGVKEDVNFTFKEMLDKSANTSSHSESENISEACWPGYMQKGMKKKGNRMVPNCVPKEETEIDEAVLSIAQRKQRAMRLRRMQKRIQRARARQMKRFADPARLKRRAVKAAYKALRKRFSGGKDYTQMGAGEKMGLDKRLQKALPAIKKLAVRLLPTVRKREIERKKSAAQAKNESFEAFLNEGPSRYYSGLSQSTKEKRAAHFKKMGPKADDDKSAYVDAPGDKEAREKRMRQSVHTKRYKEMFGEEIDKKELSRLDQLVRLGLADKKLLQVIKRGVTKLESGEMLNPQERKAAFDLLQTLLDMTLSTDQLFRMTRTQLQKESVDEDVMSDFTRYLSTMTHKQGYEMAAKELKSLLARKDNRHDKSYYAAMIAKSYPGVDARQLSAMIKEDYDTESDGISMAQIEVENLIDDAEDILDMLSEMDEEPEQWVLSKITKSADYIGTVRDYLEFQDYDDEYDDEDDEDDYDDEYDDEDIDDAFVSMIQDGLQAEEYELLKPIVEEIEGLKKKAEKSGIAYGILKKVYDRGMAAWQGGHRPGATPQQWAFARVNSFITKGKGTWGGADKDLAAKVSTNEEFKKKYGPLEIGTDDMRIAYARMTPGQNPDLVTAKYSTEKVLNVLNDIRTQRAKKLFDEEKDVVKEAIEMHLDKKIPFVDNVFRVGSENYFRFFREARQLNLQLEGFDKYLIEETDIGEIVEFEGQHVPLDCPMVEEWEEINEEEEEGKDPPLNKPKRGGPKKFYVYVRKPDGGIKKVTWGDTSGLSVKMNDPEARKSFAARHQCSTQKDRTSAAYWACNTPRYAKQLGLSGGGSFYW
jgi:hypothetical protein